MLTPREKSTLLEAQRRVEPVMLQDSKPNTLLAELFYLPPPSPSAFIVNSTVL